MDLILYRYLLRRLVLYPVTFSRNKNFDSYNSPEGIQAVKRAKTLKKLIKDLNSDEYKVEIVKTKKDYMIKLTNEKLHLFEKHIINEFEKELIKKKIRNEDYFSG